MVYVSTPPKIGLWAHMPPLKGIVGGGRVSGENDVFTVSKNLVLRLSQAFYRIKKAFFVAKWEHVKVRWCFVIYRDFLYK